MLEKEYKCLLSQEEYNRVRAHFDWDSEEEQANHYYADKAGITTRNRIMFRVRTKNGKSVIQVKTHKNAGSPLQICEENEFPVPGIPAVIKDPERYTGIESGELYRLGMSVTYRSSKMWDKDTEICLDKTTYFNKCDYEIEIEYKGSSVPDALQAEIKALGIEFKESSVGKFSRFLTELKKIQGRAKAFEMTEGEAQ